jgi:ribosomal protein S16
MVSPSKTTPNGQHISPLGKTDPENEEGGKRVQFRPDKIN